MEQDLFKYLPFEIIDDILLRLPLRSIAASKCVCKSWRNLLKKDEFIKSHLSRSPAALFVLSPWSNSNRCTLYELKDDEIDVESSHDHHYNRLTKLDFPHKVRVLGSANGLLFLVKYRNVSESTFDHLYVWNPISREYIALHCPVEIFIQQAYKRIVYGFGVSKISGQYKVVQNIGKSDCYVYTLGTGSWRRVEAAGVSFDYSYYSTPCVFLYGNLHWLVFDSDENPWISCFDLETECFSTLSTSPVHQGLNYMECKLCALRDCLSLCDDTSLRDGIIDIWLMKEYGVGKYWTKEYVINFNPDFDRITLEIITLLKVFKDGDILMQWGEKQLFYYSNKAKTTQELGFGLSKFQAYSVLLTPSFLSLKSFGMENVISLSI